MRHFLCIIILIALSNSCGSNDYYPEDSNLSNYDGQPRDSSVLFFPKIIKIKDSIHYIEMVEFYNQLLSANYREAKEPILYNYYLEQDVYRFLLLRSFYKPVIFSLVKKEEQITLTTKILDKEPNPFPKPIFKNNKELNALEIKENDSLWKISKTAKIIYNKTQKLSIKDWRQFEKLIERANFWNMHPNIDRSGLDGSQWIIESHLKNKYWYVNRWSPNDKFEKIGDYLILKSKVNLSEY